MRQTELPQELAKSAGPIGVAGLTIYGFPISDWILVLVAVYTLCQIIVIMPKVCRTIISRRKRAE